MSEIEGYPLPPTSYHDAEGKHVAPHIPAWRRGADQYPGRVVRGSEVERDQRNKARFHKHLEEHRRRGESAEVVEWL